ncbi:MAG: tetratricopeptide repeat protein [Deltaproteobacteria bacterium]|nr:tetratricopeptide repeat protein [Deltaproteobacteria bacterium]
MAKKSFFGRIFGIKKSSGKTDVKSLKEKIDKNPKDIKAILKLGDHYYSKRKKQKALEYYSQAADLCIEDGFINKGIAIIKKITSIQTKDPQIYQKLAELYMRQNLFGEAILQLQKVLELDPDNEEAKATLEKLSTTSEEQATIIEALRADREVQIAATQATNPEDILKEAKEQIRKQITDEDVTEHYDLGVAYMEMELYESAIEEFGITLNNPDYFEDSIRLIYESFFALDRMQEAVAYYESLLSRTNLSPLQKEIIRFHIGMAYEDSLETEKALEIYEDLLERGYPKPDLLMQRIEKLKHS